MKRLTVIGLVWASSIGAQSRWVNIADAKLLPIYMDTVTASTAGHVSTVWIRYYLPTPRTVPATKDYPAYTYKWWQSHYVVDCQAKKFKGLEDYFYDSVGNVVHSVTETGYETFQSPPPETVGEDIVAGVCKWYP